MAEPTLSREEAGLVAVLRRTPSFAEHSYAFASFAFVFSAQLGLPSFTLSELELSLIDPLARPLCVEILLRLLPGATLPEPNAEPQPVAVPSNWESRLSRHLEPDEEPEEDVSPSSEKRRPPPFDFFAASPAERLRVLCSLCDDACDSDLLQCAPPPLTKATNLPAAVCHGCPALAVSGDQSIHAVPCEPRLWRQTRRPATATRPASCLWECVSLNEPELLSFSKASPALAAALQKSVLTPLAERRSEKEAAIAAARDEESAALQAVLNQSSRSASLRSISAEEASRREGEREKQLKKLAAKRAEKTELKREALRRLIPTRLRAEGWQAKLFSPLTEELGVWVPPPRGEEAVGRAVSVWWPAPRRFYKASCVGFDAASGKHRLVYTDGDKEEVDFEKEGAAWH